MTMRRSVCLLAVGAGDDLVFASPCAVPREARCQPA